MFKLAQHYTQYAFSALAAIGFGIWQIPHIPRILSALMTIGIWQIPHVP